MDSQDTLRRSGLDGANQSGLRDRNARVVLSLIRRHGELASADIARRSGLSAQTVSNIVRDLSEHALITRRDAIKGKVGKPSVPVALNPEGAFSLGLSIGRRSAELVLVDFHGTALETVRTTYPYPAISEVFDFVTDGLATLYERHPHTTARIIGLGVARPNKIWSWLEAVKAPEAAMQKWQELDLVSALNELTGLDVIVENDATSACVAEHLLGRGEDFTDFAYIFIGAFIGGGLVLNGKVFSGQTGSAASLGPLPMPTQSGGTVELLTVASLHVLEKDLKDAGINPMDLRVNPTDWSAFEPQLGPWIEKTAHYLALASASIASILEVEAVLIDGAMPDDVRVRMAKAVDDAFSDLDITLIERPKIELASVGRSARSIGAAILPIHARYFLA